MSIYLFQKNRRKKIKEPENPAPCQSDLPTESSMIIAHTSRNMNFMNIHMTSHIMFSPYDIDKRP